jgi:hypothetical protein
MKKIIKISPDGKNISYVHDDRLAGMMEHGEAKITRASHVEPTPNNKWTADLSPVKGPILGPYNTRKEALEAEINWLNNNGLGESEN